MKQTPEEFIEKKLEQVDEKFGDVYIHTTGKHYMSDTTLTNRYEKSCFYELKAFLKDALTQLKALYEEEKKGQMRSISGIRTRSVVEVGKDFSKERKSISRMFRKRARKVLAIINSTEEH